MDQLPAWANNSIEWINNNKAWLGGAIIALIVAATYVAPAVIIKMKEDSFNVKPKDSKSKLDFVKSAFTDLVGKWPNYEVLFGSGSKAEATGLATWGKFRISNEWYQEFKELYDQYSLSKDNLVKIKLIAHLSKLEHENQHLENQNQYSLILLLPQYYFKYGFSSQAEELSAFEAQIKFLEKQPDFNENASKYLKEILPDIIYVTTADKINNFFTFLSKEKAFYAFKEKNKYPNTIKPLTLYIIEKINKEGPTSATLENIKNILRSHNIPASLVDLITPELLKEIVPNIKAKIELEMEEIEAEKRNKIKNN